MAKLVVFKAVRPNTNVDFFVQTDAEKAGLVDLGVYNLVADRVSANSLSKVRTVFFPADADFNTWNTSAINASIEARKAAEYQTSGVTETREVFDVAFTM